MGGKRGNDSLLTILVYTFGVMGYLNIILKSAGHCP